jgi:ribosomal protein L40E
MVRRVLSLGIGLVSGVIVGIGLIAEWHARVILPLAIVCVGALLVACIPVRPAKKICLRCGGSGYVPAVGAWATEYDADTCPRCGGSGRLLQQSSPLEEDGYCMTDTDI